MRRSTHIHAVLRAAFLAALTLAGCLSHASHASPTEELDATNATRLMSPGINLGNTSDPHELVARLVSATKVPNGETH